MSIRLMAWQQHPPFIIYPNLMPVRAEFDVLAKAVLNIGPHPPQRDGNDSLHLYRIPAGSGFSFIDVVTAVAL